MGWLYMQHLSGHAGPREYLDDQYTSVSAGRRIKVLRSALVTMRTYYAAVEVLEDGKPRQVSAAVCLVRYNLRDKDGYVFGYKSMGEEWGPCEASCPAAVLDLLTPTENAHALDWRARCRAALAARAAKPKLKAGQVIVFEYPIAFTDGSSHRRMVVVVDHPSDRKVRFRPEGGGGRYRISGLNTLAYTVEGATPKKAQDPAPDLFEAPSQGEGAR